jgi:hypothetical protein
VNRHMNKKNTLLGRLIAKYRAAGTLTVASDIPDRRVEMLFNTSRVFIAPLLNATGVATKCIHALSQGMFPLIIMHGMRCRHSLICKMETLPKHVPSAKGFFVSVCVEAAGGVACVDDDDDAVTLLVSFFL